MTHPELLERKALVDFEAAELKAELEQARTEAYLKDLYMPPADYEKKARRLAFLKLESQRIQAAIAKAKFETQQAFEHKFVNCAKALLAPAEWERIAAIARMSRIGINGDINGPGLDPDVP